MEKETTDFDVSMRVIALQDLWDIFIHRLWVIVLAAVLVTGAYIAFDNKADTHGFLLFRCIYQPTVVNKRL